MTKQDLRDIIDAENGEGYSYNINLDGYVFTKNGSFIIFQFKTIEDVRICHIKYIYFKNQKDFINILVNCCNFWMGNKIEFIFYKEKDREKNSAIKELKELNFREDIISTPKWNKQFKCKKCGSTNCNCYLHNLYK